jgi:hypothetical protein
MAMGEIVEENSPNLDVPKSKPSAELNGHNNYSARRYDNEIEEE